MITPVSSPTHSRPSTPTRETSRDSQPISEQAGPAHPVLAGRARSGSASPATSPPRNALLSSPAAVSNEAVIRGLVNEVSGQLSSGALATLQQGVNDGFASLPPAYRDLGMQTARLVGLVNEPAPTGPAMPFPALAPRLEAVAVVSSQLVEATKLDSVSAALLQNPQQRADMLAPHVKQLKDAGHVTAAAINQMPVAELRANREVVKDQLTAWAGATETLHDQLKAQLGETHPVTVAALEARTEASAVYGKTMMRMAIARLGGGLYDLTVGKAVAGVSRLFGAGN